MGEVKSVKNKLYNSIALFLLAAIAFKEIVSFGSFLIFYLVIFILSIIIGVKFLLEYNKSKNKK